MIDKKVFIFFDFIGNLRKSSTRSFRMLEQAFFPASGFDADNGSGSVWKIPCVGETTVLNTAADDDRIWA